MNRINVIAVGVGLLIMGFYVVYLLYSSGRRKKTLSIDERLSKTSLGVNQEGEVENLTLLKTTPTEGYFKSKLPKIEGLKEWILHAGLEIRPSIFVSSSITFGLFIIMIFIFALKANILISILLGILSSFLIPWAIIATLTARNKRKFLEEFPIALDIIRRALRAGHSIDRSITMVIEQVSGPVGQSFKRIVDQLSLGKPFDEVLADMANRLGIDDFRMLAIVIVLQRETGGSLAESIDNFSKIIRARQQLRKKVKALTAEVRVTAMILTAIPFCIFLLVYVSTPRYFDPLFYTQNGQTLLIIGIVMLVAGIGIIIRMAYRESY
jgi:tight adherence protein B